MNWREYKKYLQTDHWKQFRRKTITNKCWNCGNSGMMNLHHTNYDNLYRETYMDVLTLCEGCHKEVHKLIKSGAQKLATAHLFLKGLPIPLTPKRKKKSPKQDKKTIKNRIRKSGYRSLSRKDSRQLSGWFKSHPNWK